MVICKTNIWTPNPISVFSLVWNKYCKFWRSSEDLIHNISMSVYLRVSILGRYRPLVGDIAHWWAISIVGWAMSNGRENGWRLETLVKKYNIKKLFQLQKIFKGVMQEESIYKKNKQTRCLNGNNWVTFRDKILNIGIFFL